MKKYGSTNANDRVAKKIARKMLSMPFWAYWVQISTTRRESSTEAFFTDGSRLMFSLMNSTARNDPVVTAWIDAPVIEKIMVVAPTTAVPMSTGLAVALNVLPAPSFSSSMSLAMSHFGVKPKSFSISSVMPGTDSIRLSSYTDWALSVTGPYESTAMVTGPIPRKPKATRPKANTAGAIMSWATPWVLTKYATDMRPRIAMPSQ